MKKLRLYFYTLRYLKPKQIFFQLFYRIKKKLFKRTFASGSFSAEGSIKIVESIHLPTSYLGNNTFSFLNLRKDFGREIDWNFSDYGKLWAYNLNYFDYLNQRDLNPNDGLQLLHSFCECLDKRHEGNEPYPISLRGLNWIKFFTKHKISEPSLDGALFRSYRFLASNLEYHLLGNHLLENGFSLLFGAYYFKNEYFYKKAKSILLNELHEQVLKDGGHFELSPMYHQILLFRLMDCINLLQNNAWQNQELLEELTEPAEKMLGWLASMTFSNGDIPMVNDAAYGIAPSSSELFTYAERLKIKFDKSVLSDSGYRMIRTGDFELMIDIGRIGPDYIPGHAHSDTFNFILYYKSEPLIVDTGTSTYDSNRTRAIERSTASHNTVVVKDYDQSEVWASFRVGRRASVKNIEEMPNLISAQHDGYKRFGITHSRAWKWSNSSIEIIDNINKSNTRATAFLHFHPLLCPIISNSSVYVKNIKISFSDGLTPKLEKYEFASGFNTSHIAHVVKVEFHSQINCSISLQ